MDRQEKLKKNDSSENGSDHGSNEESDNEDKVSVALFCLLPTINAHEICFDAMRYVKEEPSVRREIKTEQECEIERARGSMRAMGPRIVNNFSFPLFSLLIHTSPIVRARSRPSIMLTKQLPCLLHL